MNPSNNKFDEVDEALLPRLVQMVKYISIGTITFWVGFLFGRWK